MFNRLLGLIRTTVRYKILVLVLFPILVVAPIALFFAIYWGNSFAFQQLLIKVNTDLSVSHDAFERLQTDYLAQIERLAESYAFRTALESRDNRSIEQQITLLKVTGQFTYLALVDSQTTKPFLDLPGQNKKPPSISSAALALAKKGQAQVGIEIFNPEQLARVSAELARQQVLSLVETPRARLSQRKVEDRGMMIRAIYPIKDKHNRVVALLDGGILLNGNFDVVDNIRDLVYGPGSLIPGSRGTVTIFLEDVRISTNVPLHPGERALGTRVSNDVRTRVLDNGKQWIDRAFVVNDWYISAYEPIIDMQGNRVGILYAGFLEKPFKDALWKTVFILIVLFLLLMALSIFVAIRGAKTIFKPLELISRVIDATREGKVKRVGRVASQDELGKLSHEFDVMLDLLSERNRQIHEWAGQLEDKVKARTSELQHKNDDLQSTIHVLRETRQQLVIAEKLAALGELTAGVAHEINNPTAVILGNLDIIVDELGVAGTPVQAEIDLVIEQVYRIQEIINNLLQYASPDQYTSLTPPSYIDVNSVVEHTLALVQHLRKSSNFQLVLQLEAGIHVKINPNELQQVLVNLVVNAVHALEEGGDRIQISTADWNDHGVVIRVQDNGVGMRKEQLKQVFDPFYSTKDQGKGTGLGLSISYGIIRRYGGNITIESNINQGTTFSIWLHQQAKIIEDDVAIAKQLHSINTNEAN